MSIYMILIDIHIYQRHNINQFLVDFIITQNFDRKTFTFSIKKIIKNVVIQTMQVSKYCRKNEYE